MEPNVNDSMVRTGWRVVLLSTALIAAPAATGCSSSSGTGNGAGPGDAAAVEAASGDGDVGDAASPTSDAGDGDVTSSGVSVRFQVVVQVPVRGVGPVDAGAAPPIVGATACVHGMPSIPCATTDATGIFELTGLPSPANLTVTIDQTGYRSLALVLATSGAAIDGVARGTGPLALFKTSDGDPPVGTTIDWTKGQVEFFAIGPGALSPGSNLPAGVPGATVTLTPAGGFGPVFLTDQNTFDAGATKLIDAIGFAWNLAAGEYTLTVAAPSNDCEAILNPFTAWGYPGESGSHEVKFPILAGYTTLVGEYCGAPLASDAGTSDGAAPITDAGPHDGAAGDAH